MDKVKLKMAVKDLKKARNISMTDDENTLIRAKAKLMGFKSLSEFLIAAALAVEIPEEEKKAA